MATETTHKANRPRQHRIPLRYTVCLIGILWLTPATGAIVGICYDCHTMHRSQDDEAIHQDSFSVQHTSLTRKNCLGCHAGGGRKPTVHLGTDILPQVMHSGANDLAGGNFGYITGLKGSGAADNKGHNIGELTGTDGVLYTPPGGIIQFGHDNSGVNTETLTCAGNTGCHGYRYADKAYPDGITGAHHDNVDGQLNQADTPAKSYRFLMGVKGFESDDWQEHADSASHNEYFGLSTPVLLGCGGAGELSCHSSTGGIQPPNGTMSQFCATCHGNFHTLKSTDSTRAGNEGNSPFIRHPTDLALPSTGEYADYTVYNLQAPVARITVSSAADSTVTPGSDIVMCLSCHVAHASNYASMLRWDYSTMIAGNAGSAVGTGCFVCHTTKD